MKAKLGILSLVLLVSLLATLVLPVAAAAQGPLYLPPTCFYGCITVNGTGAPPGTVIYGKIVGAVGNCASPCLSVTQAGKYGVAGLGESLIVLTDSSSDKLKPVEFYVKVPWSTLEYKAEADRPAVYDMLNHEVNLSLTVKTKPCISGMTPAEAATGVAVNAAVSLTFNESISAVDLSCITISDVSGVTASVSDKTINICHDDFSYSKTYTVTVPAGAVKNSSNLTNDAFSWSFTTQSQPSGGGSSGGFFGGGAPVNNVILTSFFGTAGKLIINSNGVVQEDFETVSANGKITLRILKNTVAKNADGSSLSSLTGAISSNSTAFPSGYAAAGPVFDLRPAGAVFEPSAILTCRYDSSGITESTLVMAYLNTKSEWTNLPGSTDAETHTLTVRVSHFTTFAAMGRTVAAFTPTLKSVSPTEAPPGTPVTITVSVANSGGTAGSFNAVLKINGVAEQDQKVDVPAGGSAEVAFTVTKNQPGEYTFSVGTIQGKFKITSPPAPAQTSSLTTEPVASAAAITQAVAKTSDVVSTTAPQNPVEPSSNLPLIIGITAAVIIAGGLAYFLIRPKHKTAH